MRFVFLLFILGMSAGPVVAEEPNSQKEAQKPAIEEIGPHKFRLGTIEFDSQTREITFPAAINAHKQGILEYVLVHESGKTHESLLKTQISATDLQIVLKLLRYQSGKGTLFDGLYPPGELPQPEPRGDSLHAFVSWEGASMIAVESLVQDLTSREPMEPTEWVLNGSEIIEGQFMANVEGSYFSLYLDPLSLFNSAHNRNWDDENWYPILDLLPKFETPVTVTLKPATREEAKPESPPTDDQTPR